MDADDRQRDQPGAALGPILGDDESPAVGGVAALLGAVVTRMQDQLPRLRPRGDRDRRAARSELQIREADHQKRDQHESRHPREADPALRLPCAGLIGSRLGRRFGHGLRLVLVQPRQPLEPAGQVPVGLAEQLHRRRQEHRADDRRVEQDCGRKPDAELLEERHRKRSEDREDAHHDERGTRDDAGSGLDPLRDRLVHGRAAVEPLPDPADDEDVVVHRKAEQDHEQEQRHDRLDPVRGASAEEALADAVLEDEHEHAVGGCDREQVEHDRLDRNDDRAEGDQHQHEREEEDECDDGQQARLQRAGLVLPFGGLPGDAGFRVRNCADGLGHDRLAQHAERRVRCRVGSVPCDRDGDVGDRAFLVDVDRDRFEGAAAGDCPPLERPIAACTAGACTFGALTTTLAGSAVPGNACCIRSYVLMTSSDCGNDSVP